VFPLIVLATGAVLLGWKVPEVGATLVVGASKVKGSTGGLAAMLQDVEPARHLDVLDAAIRERAAAVLRTTADRIDPERPLRDYGIDSLLAVELRVSLGAHLGVGLTTMEILAGASARALARAVLRAHSPTLSSNLSLNGAPS